MVIKSRIYALDSAFRPVRPGALQEYYLRYDTVINDQVTWAGFRDNYFYPSGDYMLVPWSSPTLHAQYFAKSRKYTMYYETLYSPYTGDSIGQRIAFILPMPVRKISGKKLQQTLLHYIHTQQSDKLLVNQLMNRKTDYWINESIQLYNTDYPLDSCQQRYRLRLLPNHRFEHSYAGDTVCNCAAMHPELQDSSDTGREIFFRYPYIPHYAYIENPTGYWYVQDGKLVLLSNSGRRLWIMSIRMNSPYGAELECPYCHLYLKRKE